MARQGLDEAARGNIDLVILDLGLPDMSGLEFIRDLRTLSPVPILILLARAARRPALRLPNEFWQVKVFYGFMEQLSSLYFANETSSAECSDYLNNHLRIS